VDSPTASQPEFAIPVDADFRNGAATAALTVGLIGLVLCPLGIVAIVLGILGLVRARHDPLRRGQVKALVGITLGLVNLAELGALRYVRTIAQRAVCAQNLAHMGAALLVYAGENNGCFPIAPFLEPDPNAPSGVTQVAFIGQMGATCNSPLEGEQLGRVHPSRSTYLLLKEGAITSKVAVCPSTYDPMDDHRNPDGTAGLETRLDWRGYPYFSYGYQLPFGARGRPSERLDHRVAIMADRGPFFEAAPQRGFITPDRLRVEFQSGTSISLRSVNSADPTAIRAASARTWRPYNSPNHGRKGQNVLFAGGYVVWADKPIVGVDHDNIYTVQRDATPAGVMLGNVPADYVGPLTNTDSVIVP
jgi:hypothetical protein